jgi:hypothetical protein
MARISFAPVFSSAARAVAALLPDFGISFDHVRVRIVRPPSEVVVDTTIEFKPGQADATLDFTVTVRADGESFQITMDYLNSGVVVFHGNGAVKSHAADAPTPPQEITLQYVGPGANVTRIAVSPKTSDIVAPTTVNFTFTAFDANNSAVATVPVLWTSSDPSVATISNTGTLTTAGKRGTVTVTATTPTNATDNASVIVRLGAAGIVLVSGGGQSGQVGATLSQPAVVRLVASDGGGVPITTVSFSAPAGGKVSSASVLTDTSGAASVTMTLGLAVGVQNFTATAGSFSVSIPATARAGDPAFLAAVSGTAQVDTVTKTLKLPFTVLVTDKLNNPVPGVTVNWVKTKGSGAVASATSVTGANGQASTMYTLGTLIGIDSISASISGVTSNVIFSVQALAGAATSVIAVAGTQQAARVLQTLSPFVVKVTDSLGNPVAGRTVPWTALGGSLSPTTSTDTSGLTSNTMTLGQVAGTAIAIATVGQVSVQFSATVQAGPVAKLVFLTPPSPTGPLAPMVLKPVQVALQDAFGNQTPSTNAVTMALGANPGSATLGGTVTRNAASGVATFNDLTIDELQAGYTLVASSASAPNITSAPFNVTAGLLSIVPASIDAVFATVPFTLNGTGFLPAATTVALTGNLVSAIATVQNGILINGNLVVVGGAATSIAQITATTPPFGVSNALSLEVGSVGGATLQVGPPEGGSGGNPYTIDCPAGLVATGLNVRAGVNVDNVQLICQPVTGVARTFGLATTTDAVGGAGGSPATLSCPVGTVLVGLKGFLGSGGTAFNDAIQGLCQSTDGGALQPTAQAGQENPGSTNYQATCPTGLALTGLRGGAGDLVDRTQIRCR